MLMFTAKLKCIVSVKLADEYIMQVRMNSWFPQMVVDIVLSDPDLQAIKDIAANKLLRGDRDGYEYNVDRFLQIVDDLVLNALSIAKLQVLNQQRKGSILFMALAICSTAIYLWKPLAGISIDILVGAAFIFFCWYFERQKSELNDFVHTQEATFADRAVKLQREFEQPDVGSH